MKIFAGMRPRASPHIIGRAVVDKFQNRRRCESIASRLTRMKKDNIPIRARDNDNRLWYRGHGGSRMDHGSWQAAHRTMHSNITYPNQECKLF